MLMDCRHAVIIASRDYEFSESSVVTVIELRTVSKLWGVVVALSPTNLLIPERSFTVLLGPSGCGKTTPLRLNAGLDRDSGGQIFVEGRDVTKQPPSQPHLAMVFQNYAVSVDSRSLTVGLQVLASSDQGINWSIITAATLLTAAPLLAAFLLFQRQFVLSFMRAGIK